MAMGIPLCIKMAEGAPSWGKTSDAFIQGNLRLSISARKNTNIF